MEFNVNAEGAEILGRGNDQPKNEVRKPKMKKFLKITGITSACILGTFLVLVLVLQYIVFPSSRLKPMVEEAMADYITCDYEIDKVELTYFSTFPKFGVQIEGFRLINPVEGAPNDTLISLPKGLASVYLSDMLFSNTMTLSKIKAIDLEANIYIDEDGNPNFNVFNMENIGNLEMPFEKFKLEDVFVTAKNIKYVNDYDIIGVNVQDVEFDATLGSWDNLLKGIEKNEVKPEDVCECLEEINKFTFTTHGIKFDAKAAIDNPSDIPTLNMQASVDISLPTLLSYISASGYLPVPTDFNMIGSMLAEVDVCVNIQDLLDQKYENAKINAELRLENLRCDYEGISLNLPYNRIQVETPVCFPFDKKTDWIGITFETQGGKILNEDQDLSLNMSKAIAQMQLSNLLNESLVQNVLLSLKSNGDWKIKSNGQEILVTKPSLYVAAEGNLADLSTLPVVKTEMSIDKIQGIYDGMSIDVDGYKVNGNSTEKEAKVNLQLNSINFNVPDEMDFKTKNITIDATATHQPNSVWGDYVPRIVANLTGIEFNTLFVSEKIEFPALNIVLNNETINVQKSKLKYGNAEFDILADVNNLSECVLNGVSPNGYVKLVGTTSAMDVLTEQFGDMLYAFEPEQTQEINGQVGLLFPLQSNEEPVY